MIVLGTYHFVYPRTVFCVWLREFSSATDLFFFFSLSDKTSTKKKKKKNFLCKPIALKKDDDECKYITSIGYWNR